MDVGIGLPNTVPGTDGDQLTEFARRAEAAGFSSVGTLDRLVYGGLEPLVTLAAAAAVTERIALRTTVLLAPYRLNAALLAKEAASVHRVSGGRLTLGLGLGWREDDYLASGIEFSSRGRRLDDMLAEIERVWSGQGYGFAGGIGPDVSSDPPKLLLGGSVDVAFRRAARHGIGWILGGGTPDQFAEGRAKLEEAWREAGRDGEPRGMALAYFSLGGSGEEEARSYLGTTTPPAARIWRTRSSLARRPTPRPCAVTSRHSPMPAATSCSCSRARRTRARSSCSPKRRCSRQRPLTCTSRQIPNRPGPAPPTPSATSTTRRL